MKILLIGGGSGGSVAPLLAIASELKSLNPKTQFLLIGTKNGPEKNMASVSGIPFSYITAGKFRRYFSLKNFLAPFLVFVGIIQSFKIIREFKPSCAVGTGSYVQVPVILVCWFLKIPVLIHQQDIFPSLANKLCQFFSSKITVTFQESTKSFFSSFGIFYKKKNADKVTLTGNPFRKELLTGSKSMAVQKIGLRPDLPTLLVLGGGTGSEFINQLILNSLETLTKSIQIIHSTGKNKMVFVKHENYFPFEFITEMADVYEVADIVVARAGLSTLTELSFLKKLSIIIPMPSSHQEYNALLLARENAAIILQQKKITSEIFVNIIRKLLFEHEASEALKYNINRIMTHSGSEKISEIILKLANEHVRK